MSAADPRSPTSDGSAPRARVAFFEPWDGGSHQAFHGAWSRRSRHRIDVLGLAPRHWQWRMEASAWELARRVATDDEPPAVVACSDYVDLPRLLGFLPRTWSAAPTLAYFHENQLTYPTESRTGPSNSYGFTGVLTAIRADALVFNSEFHRRDFAEAATELLRRLPRPSPRAEFESAIERSHVVPPAPELASIEPGPGAPEGAPLRVLFPHRLEADKDPVAFVAAVSRALEGGARLELVFVGGDPGSARDDIRSALASVATASLHVGFCETRHEYLDLLRSSDVVTSTAKHEFFGVAFAEAMAAGCTPLAPRRLSYVDWVGDAPHSSSCWPQGGGLYDSEDELVAGLVRLAATPSALRRPDVRGEARATALLHDARHAAESLDRIVDSLRG